MAVDYRSKDGDVLDWICWRHYGQQARLNQAARQIDPQLALADSRLDEHVQLLSQFNAADLRGIVEQVLDANPGLADYGSRLPAGVLIHLPDIGAQVEDAAVVQLWDD
jgi:phage tail protein X